MAFDEIERSISGGSPVSLYEFRRGSFVWAYAPLDEVTVVGGRAYQPITISDSGVQQSGDAESDAFVIAISMAAPMVEQFRISLPSEEVTATLRSWHEGDDEAPVVWVGTISEFRQVDMAKAEIVCRTMDASLDREGLRLSWDRGCPHMLYDLGCKVNRAAYRVPGVIAGVQGLVLIVSGTESLPPGWFDAGFLEWPVEGGHERVAIEASLAGGYVRLLGRRGLLKAGDAVDLYPGCQRVPEVCYNKFANLANYGGFNHLPGVSPFDGNPIF